MTLLLVLLIVAVVLSCSVGDEAARATAFVLVANWCANTAFVMVSGDTQPWPAFLTVDYISGFILIVLYTAPITKIVCLTYAAQCIAHGAYGYLTMSHPNRTAADHYWWVLYYLALAQVAIVGGTIVYQRVRDRSRAGSSVPSDNSCPAKGSQKAPRQ